MMKEDVTRSLESMRVAAAERQWTMLQETLKQLLTELDPLIALSTVAPRVRDFVPRFKHYYPEEGWVEQLLLTVVTYASAPNELPEHAVQDFRQPGCGNFVVSVFDMARAVQQKHTIYERYSHITNAAANAIIADLQYTFFKNRPALYATFSDQDSDPEERQQIQYQFWMDRTVAERDKALWLNLTDAVQQALEQNQRA